MSIRAIYKNGVFQPLEEVPVKEGTEVDVYPRLADQRNGKKPKSVRELGVYGMWKDRDDIGTGTEYVSRIRKYRDEPEKK
jgi:predicted DNA-binding antitoxin AbrB/MazE fold protein